MKALKWAALVTLAAASVAWAQTYTYLPFKMLASQDNPFRYYTDNSTSQVPGGVAVSTATSHAVAAWTTWNDAGATMAIPAGLAAPKGFWAGGTNGNSNIVVGSTTDVYSVTPTWVVSASSPEYQLNIRAPFVTSVMVPVAYRGVLQTCDIFLNAADYQYSTETTLPPDKIDVQTIMLHEVGHCLGLNHHQGTVNGQIMAIDIRPGVRQWTLGNHDLQAFIQANPVRGNPGSPCPDVDAGAPCTPGSAFRCLMQTIQDGGLKPYCAQGCDLMGGGTCPAPLLCEATSLIPGSTGACVWPKPYITDVGKACQENFGQTQCANPINGFCLGPRLPFWQNGYCSQRCGRDGDPACPPNSTCLDLTGSHGDKYCLKNCRPGMGDCRPEYACDPNASNTCIPKCTRDPDCPTGMTCRSCDGLCISQQNTSQQIGDLCAGPANCGAGQSCIRVDSSERRLCVESCSSGCTTCPSGTACVSVPGGGTYCVLTCTGAGSCPSERRCGVVGGVRACVPSCNAVDPCPLGQTCVAGECYDPVDVPEPGCIVPPCVTDAGMQVTNRRDGGTGAVGGDGGCGCLSGPDAGGSPAAHLGALGLLAFVLNLGRRRGRRS